MVSPPDGRPPRVPHTDHRHDPAIFDSLYDPVIKKGFRTLAVGYIGTRHLTTKNTPAKKPVYEKYDPIWTKELRQKIQRFKA